MVEYGEDGTGFQRIKGGVKRSGKTRRVERDVWKDVPGEQVGG